MVEAGVPGFEASSWFGLVAPAKTPPEVLKALTDAVMKVLRIRIWSRNSPMSAPNPDRCPAASSARILHAEADKWGKVVKDADVVIQ